MSGEIVWPVGFMDVAGKTFLWTWLHKKEFVDFTLTEMKRPTKTFLVWYNYCLQKTKEDNDKPTQGFCERKN